MIDNQTQINRAIILKDKLDAWKKDWNPQTPKPLAFAILERQWAALPKNLRDAVELQLSIPFGEAI